MGTLLNDLLASAERDCTIKDVRIGLHWCFVSLSSGEYGLASSSGAKAIEDNQHVFGELDVEHAGDLVGRSAREIASYCLPNPNGVCGKEKKVSVVEKGLGAACLLALLSKSVPSDEFDSRSTNDILFSACVDKYVTVVGRFPFVERLRPKVKVLEIVELYPNNGERHYNDAEEYVTKSDVVILTGATVFNNTLEELLKFKRKGQIWALIGPSTPCSKILIERGIDVIGPSIITEPGDVANTVSQGGYWPQIRRGGGVQSRTLVSRDSNLIQ